MAIQDKAVTLVGAQAKVTQLAIVPQADGSILIVAAGVTKDGGGTDVGLSPAQLKVQPGQVAAVDNMLARALTELRKANGLEA